VTDHTKPAALLFDLDGTIVDTIELIMQSMEFSFSDFDGPKPTRGEWLEGLGIPLRTQLAAHARTAEQLDWMIARYRLFQGEHHDRMTLLYPGVAEVLANLRAAGHPMAIVTSKFHAGAVKALTHVACMEHFDVIIGADSAEFAKPHPEPVRLALRRLGMDPGNALMIGDSPHDISAGNAAGVETVAVLWGAFTREQLLPANPTYWLSSIDELPLLVAKKEGGVEGEG
jgi:pyrophosphatase PpaX